MKTKKKKPAAHKLGNLTVDERLAVKLGYVNVPWPVQFIADRDFPRGVWKSPTTGQLHTPTVIRLMQTPVDPDGQPFAEPESLAAAARREKMELRKIIVQEEAANALVRAEERQRARELAALAK